ncbi:MULTISPECIES: glycoside hydrolase family 6 protein [Paenibacillus]|uniref:glycoside hydrolase family 6 protein n=1 Tax=Paenibacillus TaxID=44249 RepID=UPI0022B8C06A|nr:glycoside hydrolase family 6 protein [Paenibacillus caseinilyticus]MCZ8518540.1 glycoside hydrolase family 6 protein [Paenibacillus caseinilyticus]
MRKKKVWSTISSVLASAVLLSGLLPAGANTSYAAAAHVDNPFAGATSYVNPDYAAEIDTSIAKTGDAALKAKMETIKSYPTAVWLDRIAAIGGGEANGGRRGLEGHLDAVLAQKQGSAPITATFVIYDLPGRDCHALASNGELPLTQEGLQRYKTEYIDAIAAIFAKPKYQDIRIVTVIEPDGLPNLVTNLSDPKCAAANSSGLYIAGFQYALNKLHAIPNVYNYLDIGHSGWLGWDDNRRGAVTLYTNAVKGTTAGLASVDGLITNTANTTPLEEPYLTNPNLTLNGQPIRSSEYYEWNPNFDESDFTAALYSDFTAAGWPATLGFLVDTGRNGWGGVNRPGGASGSDINTYVNSGRIDRRAHRGLWCNNSGAGIGLPPQSAPAAYAAAHIDALVWVKPPGESDGASKFIPNDEGKLADPNCDPTFTNADGVLTGSLPDSPLAGHWFHDQFVMLVNNAFPAIPASGGNGGNPTAPAAPAGVTAAAGNAQVKLTWNASAGAASYTVKRATVSGGPYTTVASGLTSTSYTNTGLTNGTAYYYVVSAVNSAGESANSAQVSAVPSAGVTVPAAPTGLTAQAGDAQVKLTWNASAGAVSYTVKRAAVSGGPYTTVAAGLTSTSYTNTGLTNGTTYYYVVSAVNSAGQSANSAQAAATPQGTVTPPVGSLTLQYRAGNTNPADNAISPHFNIKNNGTTAVNLSDLKIRYYFTKDGSAGLDSWVDWAQVGGANVKRTFGSATGTGTDTYVELSFAAAAGTIPAGGQSGDIQLRISKSDWSNFNEAGDYSFDPSKTAYAGWDKVTLYQGGTLVWGIEP